MLVPFYDRKKFEFFRMQNIRIAYAPARLRKGIVFIYFYQSGFYKFSLKNKYLLSENTKIVKRSCGRVVY